MQIYIVHNRLRQGPFTLPEVWGMLERGEISKTDPAWHLGLPGWVELKVVLERLPKPDSIPQAPPAVRVTPAVPTVAPLPASSQSPAPAPLAISPAPAAPPKVSWLSIISLCLAGCAALAAVISLFAAKNAGTADPSRLVLVMIPLLFVLLGAFAGGVLGLIDIFLPGSKRNWAIAGMCVNGFVLLSFIAVLGSGALNTRPASYPVSRFPVTNYPQVGIYQGLTNFPTTPKPAAINPEDFSGRPIPMVKDAFNQEERKASQRDWYDRCWLQAYQDAGHRSEKWDSHALQLITEYIPNLVGDAPSPDEKHLHDLCAELLKSGCDDPLVLYLCGVSQRNFDSSSALLERSVAGLKTGKYPNAMTFFVDLRLAERYVALHRTAEVARVEKETLAALASALEPKNFHTNDLPLFINALGGGEGAWFFKRNAEAVCTLMEETPGIEPWVTHLFRGQYLVNKAAQIRGLGDAARLPQETVQDYIAELRLAEKEFDQSWKLNPRQPAAAAALIYVARALNEPQKSRLWFDRAVSAEFDYDPAYQNYLACLRPAWGGSHEAMLNFGRACLKTGRFETAVPFKLLQVAMEIAADSPKEADKVFQRPDVYRDLEKMFDGYGQEPGRSAFEWEDSSHRAIVAYRAGDFIACRRQLEELGFVLNPHALNAWMEDYEHVEGRVWARTGPAKDWVVKAEAAGSQPGQALDYFNQAEKLSTGDPRALKYIHDRQAALKLELELGAGNWVPLLPGPDFTGWKIDAGNWKVIDENTLEGRNDPGGLKLKCLAQVGGDFEVTGELELVSFPVGSEAGVTFGHLHLPGSRWQSFRLEKGRAREVAGLANHFFDPDAVAPVALQATNAFVLRCWKGRVTAYVNGKKVFSDQLPVDPRLAIRDGDALLGFGGFTSGAGLVVRYRDVQARRLTIPPEYLK